MASPQPNEFTRLSNELFEALLFAGLNGRELRVLLAVIRLTYGFGRITYRITATDLATMTGISRGNCIDTVRRLVTAQYLVESRDSRGRRILSPQKDYERWDRCNVPTINDITGTIFTKSSTSSRPHHQGQFDPTIGVKTLTPPSGSGRPHHRGQPDPTVRVTIQKENKKERSKETPPPAHTREAEEPKEYSDGLTQRVREALTTTLKSFPEMTVNPHPHFGRTRALMDEFGEPRVYDGLLWVAHNAKRSPLGLLEKMLREEKDPWQRSSVSTSASSPSADPLTAWAQKLPGWRDLTSLSSRDAQENWMRYRLTTEVPTLVLDVSELSPTHFFLAVYTHLGLATPSSIPAGA